MKITAAEYSGTYLNAATGEWEKIMLHADLIETDDYRECLYDLKKKVKNFHFESNGAEKKQAEKVKDTQSSVIELIEKCTTIPKPKGLEAYKILSGQSPELQAAYDKKLKELNAGNN